jgi:hypothetical protein
MFVIKPRRVNSVRKNFTTARKPRIYSKESISALTSYLDDFTQSKNQNKSLQFSGLINDTSSHSVAVQAHSYPIASYEDLRITLAQNLPEKFDNFIKAFKYATTTTSITYFQLLRLFQYLNVNSPEHITKELISRISSKGHISIEKFKTIWYNKNDLCAISLCTKPVESLHSYCGYHLESIKSTGKKIYKSILMSLDTKSQKLLRSQVSKLFYPDTTAIKDLLSAYTGSKYSKNQWESIWFYINSKKNERSAYKDFNVSFIHKTPISRFSERNRKPLRTKSTNSERTIKVISHTDNTVLISSFFN